MKIQQAILADAVRRLRKVASASANLPVFSHVRCTRDALGTHFVAADGDRYLTVTIPIEIGTSELSRKLAALSLARECADFLVPIETLVQVAKAADKGSKVKIEAVGFSYVTGGIEANTAVATDVPLTDFPALPILSWHNESVNADPFFKAVQEGLSHTSTDESRYVLQGMNYTEKGEVVATDGRRLYLREGLPAIKDSCIIPIATCKLVEDGMNITFNKVDKDERRYIRFTKVSPSLTIRLTSHLVDGTFPNFRQVIPDPESVKCKVQINSIELAALLRKTRVGTESIRLEISPGQLTIKGKRGSFSVAAIVEGQLKPHGVDKKIQPYICFNPDFFAEALDVGLTRISFNDTLSSCFFTSPAKPSVKVVLMPKRVSVEEAAA